MLHGRLSAINDIERHGGVSGAGGSRFFFANTGTGGAFRDSGKRSERYEAIFRRYFVSAETEHFAHSPH